VTEGPEHAPTVAASPHALHAPASSTTAITSSADALMREELLRTQRLALTGMTAPVAALLLLPLLGGDPVTRAVLVASLALFVIGNAALFYVARDPRRWTRGRVGAAWLVTTVAVLGLVYYFGLFSGALMTVLIGIYVIALGRDPWLAGVVYATSATGHAILCGLALAGVIGDRGLLSSDGLSVTVRLASAALLQATFLAAYQLARASQRTSREAVAELERAVRVIAVREAMLLEAHGDLHRAQRAGGGRYTDQVLGSYRLGVVLGRGGMGEVYEAVHVGSGAAAAVKLLDLDRAAEPGQLERFLREVAIASSLRSRHVVRVLEVGDASAPVPFLAMERLHGLDLSAWLREHGRMSVDDVVELVRQVSLGLDEARRAGIVHRDLKPQNLFRTDEVGRTGPTWKVLDFGVSKLAGQSGTLTQGAVVGTPQYMAPEQASGLDVDHRADVYALAAIAFRCLTGRPPFIGASAPVILFQVVHDPAPRASTLAPVSPAVDAVLQRGLAKHAAARPDTATELAAALAQAAAAT